MLGDLSAVVSDRTPEGLRFVEVFEGVGTILQKSVGRLVLTADAAVELAERINRHE